MEQNSLIKVEGSDADVMERIVTAGDLSKVSPEDRTSYYFIVCRSVGLNPYTKPFDLITMSGKMIMYATRTATDQLRQIHKVSITDLIRQRDGDVYSVVAKAGTPDGRTDESTGAVSIAGLKGDMLANAYMKAETKAKRRVTLSIVGLGWLDESETESIPGAQKVTIDLPKQDPLVQILYDLRKQSGISVAKIQTEMENRFNAKGTSELTHGQLQELIDWIKTTVNTSLNGGKSFDPNFADEGYMK